MPVSKCFEWSISQSNWSVCFSLNATEFIAIVLAVLLFNLPRGLRYLGHVRLYLLSFRRRQRPNADIEQWNFNLVNTQEEEQELQFIALDSTDKGIRLLYLHPKSLNGHVQISLFHASLYDHPRYLALSYVWGSQKKLHQIFINGRRFHVPTNLYQALQHLRSISGPNSGIPIWIDAICINQNDDKEKSHQVRLMTEIYENAYKVLVWLGLPTQDTEVAAAKIRALEAWSYLAVHSASKVRETGPTRGIEDKKLWKQLYTLIGHPSQSSPELFEPWEAIIRLLSNPWFNRTWIAQEVTSYHFHSTSIGNVEIVVGRQLQTISFRGSIIQLPFLLRLISKSKALATWPAAKEVIERTIESSTAISSLALITKSRRPRFFMAQVLAPLSYIFGAKLTGLRIYSEELHWESICRPLLDHCRHREATNPRDKVYALLPLVLSPSHPALILDYSLSVEMVYIRTVEAFLRYEKNLNILSSNSRSAEEFSSWVPDWRYSAESTALCTRLNYRNQPLYDSSNGMAIKFKIGTEPIPKLISPHLDTTLDSTPNLQLGVGIRTMLTLQGISLDSIAHISKILSDPYLLDETSFLSIYQPTNEHLYHAYQRTICTDVQSSGLFDGSGPESTWIQTLATNLEILERGFRNWISGLPSKGQSYNILYLLEQSGGQLKTWAWKRGTNVDKDFLSNSNLKKARITTDTQKSNMKEGMNNLIEANSQNRLFATTTKGYMALVPEKSSIGDQISVLYGGRTPFVLRLKEGTLESSGCDRRWQLIGEAYVHGFMDGEAVRDMNGKSLGGIKRKEEAFILI